MSDHFLALNRGVEGFRQSDFITGTSSTAQAPNWLSGTTYNAGQQVYSSTTGHIYSSISGGNIGNDPSTDGGVHWTDNGTPNQIELRIADGAGFTKKDAVNALDAFKRFLETAPWVAPTGIDVKL